MWKHDQMSVDSQDAEVPPMIRSYDQIDNWKYEERVFLNTLTHSDEKQEDVFLMDKQWCFNKWKQVVKTTAD